jgi:hypothetical protein
MKIQSCVLHNGEVVFTGFVMECNAFTQGVAYAVKNKVGLPGIVDEPEVTTPEPALNPPRKPKAATLDDTEAALRLHVAKEKRERKRQARLAARLVYDLKTLGVYVGADGEPAYVRTSPKYQPRRYRRTK